MTRSPFIVAFVLLVFFVISIITNIAGPLIPEFIDTFELSLGMAGFLPFSFFAAYAVMSIPSGLFMERYGERRVLAGGFGIAFAGSFAFALWPQYGVGLASVFLIGIGMAMLQVTLNPMLRAAGGERHFAFNSVLTQLVFGVGSFISPRVYSYLVGPAGLPWNSVYWLFSALTLLMIAVVLAAPIPRIARTAGERTGGWAAHASLLRHPHVRLYAAGIFSYVAMEQGVANWISQFLHEYHGLDPRTSGAATISAFWGLMTVGCVIGLVMLKLFDSRKVLMAATAAAIVALTAALFGTARVSTLAFPLVGFCASVMWSIIFSLALNSVVEHHASLSGILCTAVVGGAVGPLVIGWQGDLVGLRAAMLLLNVPLVYILSIGFWARPLVTNATIRSEKAVSYEDAAHMPDGGARRRRDV
ncbi:MAG: MFS transporter [Vicinamibacterales bacterium]